MKSTGESYHAIGMSLIIILQYAIDEVEDVSADKFHHRIQISFGNSIFIKSYRCFKRLSMSYIRQKGETHINELSRSDHS